MKSNQNNEINKNGKYLLLLLIYPLVWVIGHCTNSKIGLFPFEAEVWGNFADHIMILVTIGSVYLLYRSINHQVDAIKQQTEALNLQARDYKLRELEKRSEFNLNYKIEFHPTKSGEYFEFNFVNLGEKIFGLDFEIPTESVILREDTEEDGVYNKIPTKNTTVYRNLKTNYVARVVFQEIIERQLITCVITDKYLLKYSLTFILYNDFSFSTRSLRYVD